MENRNILPQNTKIKIPGSWFGEPIEGIIEEYRPSQRILYSVMIPREIKGKYCHRYDELNYKYLQHTVYYLQDWEKYQIL